MTLITREISIDMGHRVPNHASKCRNLHGHRYRVIATINGSLHEDGEQEGMVLDYGFLKQVMMEQIDAKFDHGTSLWIRDPILAHELGPARDRILDVVRHRGYIDAENGWKWGKLVVMQDVPTAENLAKLWFRLLNHTVNQFLHDSDDSLSSVTVWETPNCSATYAPNVRGPFIRESDTAHDLLDERV